MYVEIRRGTQVVVARVVWAKGHRAGLHAQDAILVRALLKEQSAANDAMAKATFPKAERRRVPRSVQQTHEQSRFLARAVEFACFGLVALAVGLTAFGTVEQALARPLTQARAALDR
jgi:hypothetical protein